MSIKSFIKKVAEKVFQSNWYPNKKILLESIPDMSCQTYPVFQEMLRQGLNNKYKLIWLVTNKDDYKDVHIKKVRFMNYTPRNAFEKMHRMYTLCTSRAMLYANRYIGKIFDKHLLVYLKHGTCIKSRLKHCRHDEKNESDYFITLSDFFTPYDVLELGGITEEKFIVTGYPRNDYLFDEKNYISILFPDTQYNKVILWMPTFRKTDSSTRVDSGFEYPLEVPCVYTKKDCIELNEVLKKENILLILKPHPAQKLSVIKNLNLSNFVMIYNDDLRKKSIQLYQFIGSTDALITDYSSIYYDYLLTGKPIGLTVDDYEEYSKTTGFVFDSVFDFIIGEHILNSDDFIHFIKNVSTGKDVLKDKRNEMNDLFNTHQDDRSSQRVYSFIVDQLNQRYS